MVFEKKVGFKTELGDLCFINGLAFLEFGQHSFFILDKFKLCLQFFPMHTLKRKLRLLERSKIGLLKLGFLKFWSFEIKYIVIWSIEI